MASHLSNYWRDWCSVQYLRWNSTWEASVFVVMHGTIALIASGGQKRVVCWFYFGYSVGFNSERNTVAGCTNLFNYTTHIELIALLMVCSARFCRKSCNNRGGNFHQLLKAGLWKLSIVYGPATKDNLTSVKFCVGCRSSVSVRSVHNALILAVKNTQKTDHKPYR